MSLLTVSSSPTSRSSSCDVWSPSATSSVPTGSSPSMTGSAERVEVGSAPTAATDSPSMNTAPSPATPHPSTSGRSNVVSTASWSMPP